jgi:hypothetical protein
MQSVFGLISMVDSINFACHFDDLENSFRQIERLNLIDFVP